MVFTDSPLIRAFLFRPTSTYEQMISLLIAYGLSVTLMPDIQFLRRAIPPKCFKPKLSTSLYHILRDVTLYDDSSFHRSMLRYIPSARDGFPVPFLAWSVYGVVQGLACTSAAMEHSLLNTG